MSAAAAAAKTLDPSDDLTTLRLYASRFFACLLWLHVPVVALIATSNHISIWGVVAVMSVAAAAGTLAAIFAGGTLAGRLTVAAALTMAPALMVYAGQGPWQVDWHLYFFVVFGMLVAYVDWRPIAVAAAVTTLHHLILDALFPATVFPESGFGRVGLHAGIVLVDALVLFWIVHKMRALFNSRSRAFKKVSAALAKAELLQSVVVNSSDAVIISEVPRDETGAIHFERRTVVYANDAFTAISGIPTADVMGKLLNSVRVIEADPLKFAAALEAAGRHETAKIDLLWCLPDGRQINIEASFVAMDSEDGTFMHLVAVERDVTERRRSADAALRTQLLEKHNAALEAEIHERKLVEDRLAHAAYHDELTDLPNRRLLRKSLGDALARGTSASSPAIVVYDIDHFKQINGGLGQEIGDQLVIAIGQRLGQTLRATETLGRLGGDVFSILVEGAENVEELTAIASRNLSELTVPFQVGPHQIYLTASAGVGIGESGDESPDIAFRKADLAMQRAKKLGTGRCELFTPTLLKTMASLMQLENELRGALERREMHAFYQPIVDLKSGRPVGFEALARWVRPDGTITPPNDFIPIAEETGIIVPLGSHMLEQACRELRRWIDAMPQFAGLWISVNASPLQLREPNYLATVAQALARSGLAGSQLHLEITETTIAGDLKTIGPILSGLRDLGVHISIDDFGTGYSSLRYLDQLPIDSLKIDRSFVSGRGEGVANLKITQTVVSLARELGLDVVAEGVETRAQANALQTMIAWGQGYLFGRPMNAAATVAYLQKLISLEIAHVSRSA
jgi:diguanylate cyclase (GGDEF)-like protein/PAS domain S-box-containing protein